MKIACVAVFVVCVLSACTQGSVVVAPKEMSLRNPTKVLAGTARFDADRFAGNWTTTACLGRCAAKLNFGVSQTGAIIETTETGSRAFRVDQNGILRETEGNTIMVVMWVDEGFRTAAIGTADGTQAAILDRGMPSADRTQAATDILDFNGWDIRRLKKVVQ